MRAGIPQLIQGRYRGPTGQALGSVNLTLSLVKRLPQHRNELRCLVIRIHNSPLTSSE